MKTWRNLIMLIAFLGFCLWYGGTWAYRTQFAEPRAKLMGEIEQAEKGKKQLEDDIASGTATLKQLAPRDLRRRSLPVGSQGGIARTLYHSWLIEAGESCQFENFTVTARDFRATGANSFVVSFQLNARTTLDELSRFLYEFYWVPFTHRINILNILPVENADLVDITMQIEGLIIPELSDPNAEFPLRDRLPGGYYWRRLSSGLLETYTGPIDSRNLLQFSRGGVDASDYARLTGIVYVGGEPEFWFRNQLEDNTVRVKLNQPFRIGSFIGKIVEVVNEDVVLETSGTLSRPAMRWFLGQGELLKDAMAVPYEH